jgi:hypothetical protein
MRGETEIKRMTIADCLTPEESERAEALGQELRGTDGFTAALECEIINPNMGRINALAGSGKQRLGLGLRRGNRFQRGRRGEARPSVAVG